MNQKAMGNGKTFLSFAKSSGIFFIGNTMSKVITLLLIPLYTNTLPSADYGYFDLSITYATLLTSFLYCDIWSSVMRMMRDNLEGESPWKVVASGWSIFAFSTFLYVAIAIAASFVFEIPSLELILLYGVTTNIQSMYSCIARGMGSNVDFAISGVLATLANVLLNIVLILWVGIGYEALYISYSVGFIVQCVFLAARLRVWEHVVLPSILQIKELFIYSAPLGINSVAYWFLNSLSRVVVSMTLSLAANGVFAIGSKFGSTIALATTCFTLAWQDVAFSNELRSPNFYSTAVVQYTGFLLSCTAILMPLISLAFPFIVGSDYTNAYEVVPSFLWVAVASAVSTFIGNIFYVIKDTRTIGYSMVCSCAINVVLVYPLTVTLGCMGANLSVLIAFVANVVIRLRILKSKIHMQVRLRSIVLPLALLLLCSTSYFVSIAAVNVICFAISLLGFFFIYKTKILLLIESMRSRMGSR